MAAPREIDILFLAAAKSGEMAMIHSLTGKYENGEGPGKVRYAEMYSDEGLNALHLAARAGNTHVCRFLIDNLEFDVNAATAEYGANGDSALFLSARKKHRETTVYLIENGADVNKRNIFGETPLHYAAKEGSKGIVKLLLSKGCDVNAMSVLGVPLHAAARYGNHRVLKYLLDHKADPNPDVSFHEQTPLFAALKAKAPRECVKLLLEAGADPNQPCFTTTPLKWAACQLDVEIIKLLLEAGADPNIQDPVGNTPLESAAFVRRKDAVELLFPLTSPIAKYPRWNCNEVRKYQDSTKSKNQFKTKFREVIPLAKAKGAEAFQRKNYADALSWYVQATTTGEVDSKLLSNMSLCCTKLNYGDQALEYAKKCVKRERDWAKAHYLEGAAWNVLKKFDKAADAFSRALARSPDNEEIKKAYTEVQAELDRFKHWNEDYICKEFIDNLI